MNEERWYETWKRRHAEEPAPFEFAERVMAAVAAAEMGRRSRWVTLLLGLWSSRLSKIGVCALAVAACLFRLTHVVAIFVVW